MKEETSINVQDMADVGMHLGHRTSKLNPKMEDFVVGIKNTVHVIDLEKTAEYLKKALDFVEEVSKNKQVLMLVGTKPPLKRLVKSTAEEMQAPYVTERWLGGTLTNFDIITKRAQYLKLLESEKETGKLEKYTKKEQLKKEKELTDLSNKFGGIKNMSKTPDVVFICDIIKDDLALKEAKAKGIKTIAIIDTNGDPSLVDFPIPANDDAISSVRYILDRLKDVFLKHKE